MLLDEKRTKCGEIGLGEMEEILSSLSSQDALMIFVEAGEGIESSTETIEKLDLTQKRYYLWLKKLIGAGLVEKRENVYVQTTLGGICSRLGRSLTEALKQRDQLELADKLMRSVTLSAKEKQEVLDAISKKGILETFSLADIIHEVRMVTDHEIFLQGLSSMLANAREVAYLAMSMIDLQVTDAVLKAVSSGKKVFILSTKVGFSESLSRVMVGTILSSESAEVFRELVSSNQLNVRLTENLAYSFLVADGQDGIIELPHANHSSFCVAFKFKDTIFCHKLVDVFTSMYESGAEDKRVRLFKEYSSPKQIAGN